MSNEVDDFLEHYGVKGMKWGVRKDKRIERLERVASGTGSKIDKARVALTEVSSSSVVRNKGLSGAAANKATNMRARQARIASGKATVRDMLANAGGDRLVDTGRADKGKTGNLGNARGKRIERLEKVGSGEAGFGTKLRVAAMDTSTLALARRGGLKNASRAKAERMKAVDARLKAGEGSALDLIKRAGGDRILDLGARPR